MKNYSIVVGSPIDYDYLTADVVYKGKYILRVQMEDGPDKMKIEFYNKILDHELQKDLLMDEFIEALQYAKKVLLK